MIAFLSAPAFVLTVELSAGTAEGALTPGCAWPCSSKALPTRTAMTARKTEVRAIESDLERLPFSSSLVNRLLTVAPIPCIEMRKTLDRLCITLSPWRDSPQPNHESARE